jgi:hypothetical protein
LQPFTWPIPPNPVLAGIPFRLQALVIDPSANPLGLITSNGLITTFGF